jgi:hypothetical protein
MKRLKQPYEAPRARRGFWTHLWGIIAKRR